MLAVIRKENFMKLSKLTMLLILLASLRSNYGLLPEEYDIEKFRENSNFLEDPVTLGIRSNNLLILAPVQGTMAFSSSNNLIGLYKNNRLIDSILLGSIPLELVSWSPAQIELKVIAEREKEYFDFWLTKSKNQNLSEYKMKYVY